MENVVHSASRSQTFLHSFGMIAVLLVLGIAGAVLAFFRRNQTRIARVATGAAGGLLLVAALAMSL